MTHEQTRSAGQRTAGSLWFLGGGGSLAPPPTRAQLPARPLAPRAVPFGPRGLGQHAGQEVHGVNVPPVDGVEPGPGLALGGDVVDGGEGGQLQQAAKGVVPAGGDGRGWEGQPAGARRRQGHLPAGEAGWAALGEGRPCSRAAPPGRRGVARSPPRARQSWWRGQRKASGTWGVRGRAGPRGRG